MVRAECQKIPSSSGSSVTESQCVLGPVSLSPHSLHVVFTQKLISILFTVISYCRAVHHSESRSSSYYGHLYPCQVLFNDLNWSSIQIHCLEKWLTWILNLTLYNHLVVRDCSTKLSDTLKIKEAPMSSLMGEATSL